MDDHVLRFGPVSVWLGEKSGKYPDGNQVLVQGGDTRVAFDTPLVAQRIGPAFETVDLVVLGHVHEDHMAGLRRVPRAAVQVHEADLDAARSWAGLARHYGYDAATLAALRAQIERDFDWAPRRDAKPYVDGQAWDLGGGVRVRAQHLPGHTAGHCALVVESEGVAFIGDIDLSGFGPYYGDATSSLDDFRESLEKVARLDAKVWVTSHHRAVITDRAKFLADLAAFASKIDERRERIVGWLREGGPRTIDELAARGLLYPPGHEAVYVKCAERRSMALHLEELVGEGRVREEARRYGLT